MLSTSIIADVSLRASNEFDILWISSKCWVGNIIHNFLGSLSHFCLHQDKMKLKITISTVKKCRQISSNVISLCFVYLLTLEALQSRTKPLVGSRCMRWLSVKQWQLYSYTRLRLWFLCRYLMHIFANKKTQSNALKMNCYFDVVLLKAYECIEIVHLLFIEMSNEIACDRSDWITPYSH